MKKIFTLFAALAMVMSMSAKPFLRGDMNGWGTTEFQNGECTVNLQANTKYQFKVDENADWSTSYGGAAITSTNCTDVKLSGSQNATIQSTFKGDYKFKWNASNKTITVVYPTEEVVKPKKDITVKAKMPAEWTKTIDAWVWTDENPNGKAVTPERDGDWYVVTQNTAASYIIFRNGAAWNGDSNQTADMRFEDNACIQLQYNANAKASYINIDCAGDTEDPTPDPEDPVDPNPGDDPVVDPDGDVWTVLGVDALGLNWTIDATDNDMVKQADGSYKLVKENLELGAGNYDYKVAKNHSWDISIPAGLPNQTLTIETSGIYNVTFVLDAACTTLTATAELVQAGEVIPVVGMHGNFLGSWADTEKFTMAADKLTASLVLTIPVGEYEFGMQIAGVWTANGTAFTRENTSAAIVGTSPNNTLSADVEGEYTFTWTYKTSTLTIAYPVAGDGPDQPENPDTPEQPEVTTISLAGTMNEWDMTANPFVVAEGGQTASLTIALEAATYEFKVVVDNKWLTNTGEMTRDNCTGWLFENLDGMDNNAKIVADVAGDYVFVWSIADSKLSVTYPVAGEEPGDEPVDPETAVDNVAVGEKAVKVIRNGQMYIIRNGVIYNAMGQIAE